MARPDTLAALATLIATRAVRQTPLRVAIDGVDASGKTTLAGELAPLLVECGHPVVRASIDGFHRSRAERYRRGPDSPEGYYHDAFDYPALRESLLLPLGPGGSRRIRRAVFDLATDRPMPTDEEVTPEDAILLLDGVFLLRPELYDLWDLRIFVDVPFEVALARAAQRDLALFGSAEAVIARYQRRYIPGQRLYLREARPRERADVVVDNTDLERPRLVVGGGPAGSTLTP